MSFEQFRRSLTVTRTTGEYDNGYWVKDVPSQVTITASVQPANDRQRKNLPEGYDVDSVLEIGTEDELNVATRGGDQRSDTVEIDGQQYEVISLERWQNAIIPHRWYLVALPDNE